MNIQLLTTFLVGMIILAATPGPGVFASMAKAVAEGFISSLYFITGLASGDSIFLILALLGMSAVAKLMGTFFIIIRITGGLYLIYLGIKIFRSRQFYGELKSKSQTSNKQSYVSGFLTTMGNPKPILFYASVLPTIINFNEVKLTDALIMIFLINLVSLLVLGTYCYIASLSKKIDMSGGLQNKINKAAGLVMMTVGSFVIWK